MMLAVDQVEVGERHRRDLGDVGPLAQSIESVGLLHPIVVTPENVLIAGERRLAACRSLGWTEVPVTVIELEEIARGEFAENVMRKDFLPSEVDAIRRVLAPLVATPHGGDRSKVESCHLEGKEPGKTRDKVGAFAGVSGRTVEKIAAVCEAAEAEPETFAPLVEEMDRTGKVDGAYRKLRQAKEPPPKPAPAALFKRCCDQIVKAKIDPEELTDGDRRALVRLVNAVTALLNAQQARRNQYPMSWDGAGYEPAEDDEPGVEL